ncbi:MAG: response regulator [Ktedonobacterales bacterium]|nr:response regulator [Ktedonobacterales bacterium]
MATDASIVLVVDDDPRMLFTVKESLELLGSFTVVTATNGVEALDVYDAHHPDCLVIDVRMPELDGYQLIRILRGDPASANTPMVILTAMAQDKDKFIGYASGVDRYLLKPIRPADLVVAIHEALGLSDAERTQRLLDFADDAATRG